jgi:hypothetical protein
VIAPPAPVLAAPVYKDTVPEFPELVVPDWNTRAPLTAVVPALALETVTPPLDVPDPLVRLKDPPVVVDVPPDTTTFPPAAAPAVVAPPTRLRLPPAPVLPLPTEMVTVPPAPPVLAPLYTLTAPEAPDVPAPE